MKILKDIAIAMIFSVTPLYELSVFITGPFWNSVFLLLKVPSCINIRFNNFFETSHRNIITKLQ